MAGEKKQRSGKHVQTIKPMCSSVDQMHAFAGHKHERNMMPERLVMISETKPANESRLLEPNIYILFWK